MIMLISCFDGNRPSVLFIELQTLFSVTHLQDFTTGVSLTTENYQARQYQAKTMTDNKMSDKTMSDNKMSHKKH